MRNESDENTAKAPLRKPATGKGLLRSGNPGNKGGTGRPLSTFTAFMASLRGHPDVQDAIMAAATDYKAKGFGAVLRAMADYDTEKPAEKHAIVGPIEVRVRIEREGRRVTAS